LREYIIMESTKTTPLEIMDTNFDLVEAMKKYANLINYVSSVVFDNWRIIPARKLQPMVYAHLRGNLGLKSQIVITLKTNLVCILNDILKACCRCNRISKNNRNGLKFLCRTCSFGLNSDLNRARSIEHKTWDYIGTS